MGDVLYIIKVTAKAKNNNPNFAGRFFTEKQKRF